MPGTFVRALLVALCVVCAHPVTAQESAEHADLRAQLMQPPKVTTDFAYWQLRAQQARLLGDLALRRKVVERGLEITKGHGGVENHLMHEYWSTLRFLGNPAEHLPYGEKLIAQFPNVPNTIFILARNYLSIGNLDRAKALLKQGQAIGQMRLNDQLDEAKLLGSLAEQSGKYEEAARHFRLAVQLSDRYAQENINNPKTRQTERANARGLLIETLGKSGNYSEAQQLLQETREIILNAKLGDFEQSRLERSSVALNLLQGRYQQALVHKALGLKYALASGQAPTAQLPSALLNHEISAYIGLGRLSDAAMSARKFKQEHYEAGRLSPLQHAVAFWMAGDLDTAQPLANQASEAALAVYDSTHPTVLIPQTLRAAIEYRRQPDAARLRQFGQFLERLKNDTSDARPLDQAIQKLLADDYLQHQTNSLNGGGDATLAFQLADQHRTSRVAQVVKEAARRAVSKQPGLAELVKRQSEIVHELNAAYDNLAAATSTDKTIRDEGVITRLRTQLRSLQDEQLQIERAISARYPQYNELTASAPVTPSDAARLLARDEVLLSLLPAEHMTYVWAITRDRAPLAYTVPLGEAALREHVTRLRQTLDVGHLPAARMPAFDVATARALHDALLGPAKALLAGRAQLIVNASGPLGQLPFGVLITDAATAQGTPWLAREHSISHVASIGAFAALRQSSFRAAATRPFIGFGDPLFARLAPKALPVLALGSATRNLTLPRNPSAADAEQLAAALKRYDQIPPLPETRDEILSMAAALGADKNADVFLGRAASRDAVLRANLADYQVISFSTHGLMAGDLPGLTQPALAMAVSEKEGDNPLLLLEDVMSLKLNADWVVLSACNTAAADGEASEALSGLARGFFYAGARSLLVTHWAVESASAQQLMTETFKRYAANKSLSRAEALRQAQLALMANPKYAHPFFWAPYALVGDGG